MFVDLILPNSSSLADTDLISLTLCKVARFAEAWRYPNPQRERGIALRSIFPCLPTLCMKIVSRCVVNPNPQR